MSEDSLPLKFLDTVTASIAGEVITWVNRKVAESKAVRRFKSKLGIDEINNLTKDILKASISDSFITVPSSKTAIKDFLNDKKNKKILSQWVINPKTINSNEDELVKKYAIKDAEKKSLNTFIEHLKKNIRKNRKKRFPPDSLQILDELDIIKEDLEEIKETSELTLSEVQKFGSEQATKEDIESLRTLISTLDTGEKLEDKVNQSQIDDIEKLIDNGAIIDAREKALRLLKKADKDNVQFRCRLNKIVASTYLKEESNQEEAIPYLKESVKCCDDDKVRYRNKSLALLLEKELDKALEEADKLISLEENVSSLGLKANILWIQGKTQDAFDLLVNKEYKNDFKHLHNISYSAYVNGDIDTAYEYAKKSIEINEDFVEGLELLSSIIARKYQQKIQDGDKIWPNDDNIEQLEKARDYSTKALRLINHQRKDQVRRLLTNRGIINHWLGNDPEAIEDLERAKENKLDDIVVLKNLCLLYALDNNDQALKGGFELLVLFGLFSILGFVDPENF